MPRHDNITISIAANPERPENTGLLSLHAASASKSPMCLEEFVLGCSLDGKPLGKVCLHVTRLSQLQRAFLVDLYLFEVGPVFAQHVPRRQSCCTRSPLSTRSLQQRSSQGLCRQRQGVSQPASSYQGARTIMHAKSCFCIAPEDLRQQKRLFVVRASSSGRLAAASARLQSSERSMCLPIAKHKLHVRQCSVTVIKSCLIKICSACMP